VASKSRTRSAPDHFSNFLQNVFSEKTQTTGLESPSDPQSHKLKPSHRQEPQTDKTKGRKSTRPGDENPLPVPPRLAGQGWAAGGAGLANPTVTGSIPPHPAGLPGNPGHGGQSPVPATASELIPQAFPLPSHKKEPFSATDPAFQLGNAKLIRFESPNRNQGDSSFT